MSQRLSNEDVARIADACLANVRDTAGLCMRLLSSVAAPAPCNEGGLVYFVQMNAPWLPIKIGITRDITRRLKTIRSSAPFDTALVGWFWTACPVVDEKSLHRKFVAHRLRGEWFRSCAEIESEIALANQRRSA